MRHYTTEFYASTKRKIKKKWKLAFLVLPQVSSAEVDEHPGFKG